MGEDDAHASANRAAQIEALYREHGAEAPLDFARALFSVAHELEGNGRYEESLEVSEVLVTRFGEESGRELRRIVAEGLVSRTRALSRLGRTDEARSSVERAMTLLGEPEGPEDDAVLGHALHAGSSVAIDEGATAEGLAGYRALAARFQGRAEPELRRIVASALRSEGVVLRGAGDVSGALRLFDQVVAGFGADSERDIARVVAAALGNRVQLLLDEGRRDEALATYGDLARRFGDSADSVLRVQAATAMLLRGRMLIAEDRDLDGIEQLGDVISRYRDDPDERLQELVVQAAATLKLLEESMPAGDPTAHPDAVQFREWFVRHIAVAEIARRLVTVVFSIVLLAVIALRPGGPVATTVLAVAVALTGWAALRTATVARDGHIERLGFLTALQHRQVDDLYDSHRAALRIVARYHDDGAPYALFLRNFDIETRHRRVERGAKTWIVTSDRMQPGTVEKKVAEYLTRHLPVVAVANTGVTTARPLGLPLPYLSLPDDGWMEVVESLVANASLIVVELEEISAGVSFELATILKLDRQDDAVIVLPGDGDVEARAAALQEQLAPFPRVALEDDIPFDDLDASPLFHDLLERIRAATPQA